MRAWRLWLMRSGLVVGIGAGASVPAGAWPFDYQTVVDMLQGYISPQTRILKTSDPKWGLPDKIEGLPKGWVPIKIVWADTWSSFGENSVKRRTTPLLSVDPKTCVARDHIDRAVGTLTCPLILTW